MSFGNVVNVTKLITNTLLTLLCLSFALGAAAQDRGNRILVLEEEIVEGRIEKPEAFYILQPTNLNYEHADLQESFIPELLRTVQEEPF